MAGSSTGRMAVLIFSENFAPPFPEKEVKDCEPPTATPVGGSSMKNPSGTFALKLLILAASATAPVVLISACGFSPVSVTEKTPILIVMDEPGVRVRASSDKVKGAFDNLIGKHGENVCNVDYYDKDQKKLWHKGNRGLTMTHAVRSKAAGNPTPVDPINLMQKVAFNDLDESQQFFSTINP